MLFCTGDVRVRAVLIVRIAFILLVSHQMIFHRTESGTESCHWPEKLKPSWFGVIQPRFLEHEDERVFANARLFTTRCLLETYRDPIPSIFHLKKLMIRCIWDFIKVKTQ